MSTMPSTPAMSPLVVIAVLLSSRNTCPPPAAMLKPAGPVSGDGSAAPTAPVLLIWIR